MNQSLNQIINKLRTFAESHLQLKGSFVFCDVADLEAKNELKYPLLWTDVLPSTWSNKIFTLSLQITCIDIVSKDLSNEQDVLSDTLQILNDLISVLRQDLSYSENFEIVDNISATPIKDSYGDEVAGWVSNIQINIGNPYNYCISPIIN